MKMLLRWWCSTTCAGLLPSILVGFAVAALPAASNESRPVPMIHGSAADAALHPAELYKRAAELYRQDKPQEATFWFYAGQLRYRFHLAARPDLKRDGDPALFGALSESVGRPINEWTFGDPDELVATLDRVLAWDEATPNTFTPKAEFAAALAKQRAGLAGLRDQVASRKQEILRLRTGNGLTNRVAPSAP